VKFSTRGYGGRDIKETVRIQTNDEQKPGLSVTIKGRVEEFAQIRPNRAMLIGKAGSPIEKGIQIIPREEFPFKITKVGARTGKFIGLNLEEKQSSGKTIYILKVENRKTEKGRYYDRILLETDHPKMPVIRIPVMGMIK